MLYLFSTEFIKLTLIHNEAVHEKYKADKNSKNKNNAKNYN